MPVMMTREERAKQFMPFDAMKGLAKALSDREERHSRVEKREILPEQAEENSRVLLSLEKYDRVQVTYYARFHERSRQGRIEKIDHVYRYLILGEEQIPFEDIYTIRPDDCISPG